MVTHSHTVARQAECDDDGQDMPRRSPLLFITGCPRSGTTLLQRMLSAHPQLAVANDTHFIPRALEKSDRRLLDAIACSGDTPLTEQLVQSAREYHRFYRLGVSAAQVDAARDGAETYRDFVCGLYDAFASNEGKQYSGEKTPDYVRCLPLLHELFPWCKSIHIVRDGRDTALSLMDWARDVKGPARFELWGEHPLAVAAMWWRWQVRRGLASLVRLGPDRHLLVKYEDLVHSPEEELRRITGFLALPFAEEMLDFNAGRVRNATGISAKKAWLAPTSGLRDWSTQMDDSQQQLFEALAGDTLEHLGYARRYRSNSPEVDRMADLLRMRWEKDLARRHPSGCTPAE